MNTKNPAVVDTETLEAHPPIKHFREPTSDEIARAGTALGAARQVRDDLRAQLDKERPNAFGRQEWGAEAKAAFALAQRNLAAAHNHLQTLNRAMHFWKTNRNVQELAAAHKRKVERANLAVQRTSAEMAAIIRWVRENYPERIEEVFAIRDAAADDFKAKAEKEKTL